MIASDYKFRVRSAVDTLAGGVDVYILAEVAVYGIVGCFLVLSQATVPRIRRVHAALFLASLYVVLLVVSAAYSPFRSLGMVRALQMVVILGLTAAGCARASRADLHRFAHGFLLLVACSVVLGVAYPMPPVSVNQQGRFTWLMVHPIPAGVYAGLAVLVAVGYLLGRGEDRPGPRWRPRTYWFLLLVVAGGLLGTQTRSAILGVVTGLLVIVWSLYRGRRLVEVWLGLCVAAAVIAIVGGAAIVSYLQRGESAESLATLNSRTDFWGVAADAVRLEPVYGYGLGASRGIFLEETGLGGGHNAVINVAVDLGIVGLAVWLCLLVALLRGAWVVPTRGGTGLVLDRGLLLGVLACLFVSGFFYEGIGAAANVGVDWLFVMVVWVSVLARSHRNGVPWAGVGVGRSATGPR